MDIKTIPLQHLEADLKRTLSECADSGMTLVVELPDHRLVTIQPLESVDDDDLINELLASNPAFRAMVSKSKAGSRKPFSLGPSVVPDGDIEPSSESPF